MRSLSANELDQYHEQGFLLVSGLVDGHAVESARRALLKRLSQTSAATIHAFVRDRAVSACFNRDVCAVAAQLAGQRKRFSPPRSVYTITVFPTTACWQWPAPHIDHAKQEDAHRTFPPPFRVGCLIYLSDIPTHAGGTIVWPGSHLQLTAAAAAQPDQYEFLASLNRDIEKLNLRPPQEITATAGDVLFYHYLCAHAGSGNTGAEPRLALNHKW